MSTQAGANDIGFFLSGGSSNNNPHLSTGGSISSFKIVPKTFNNLWANISERQARYGYKDLRIIYLKNLHPTLTFKNMRVYWNQSDKFTTMQIGRAPVNSTETSTVSVAGIGATDEPLPRALWPSVIAADVFKTVQDFNDAVNVKYGQYIPGILTRTKYGVCVEDSSAAIYNQKIARITFIIRRLGTARGNVNCKIWDSFGTEMASLGSVDSSSLVEVGTEDAPYGESKVVFTNLNNDYEMQVGDIIGVEYPGAGIDEDEGDRDDAILVGRWGWVGRDPDAPEDNASKDVIGTNVKTWNENQGEWILIDNGMMDLVYKAETYGPEGGGNPGEPCEPDGEEPGPPPPQGGYIIIQDFNDVNASTAYQVGNGAPNNIFRRAVSTDNSTATILSAAIARITFLMRRVGNPTGSVACRIWTNQGVVRQTMGTVPVTGITNQSNQWTQVPFTLENNTVQMSTGDLIGIEFTTGNAQDHIVLGGHTWNTAADMETLAASEGGQISAANDKYGVRMIYANSGNFHYEDEWEIPSDSSSMRWDYTNPPLNAEMTCYFMKSSPSSDTISCKIRGGRHTDSAPNDGCCYIPQFPCEGGTMQFQIECPHPNNHDCSTSGIDGTSLSMSSWHGYKVAWWNNGTTSVHMEAWQDKGNNSGSTPVNQWEKVQEHNDTNGSCGNIDNPLFRPKGSTSQCTFRIDENSGTDYKWLSIVEIQPGGTTPPPPGPGPPPAPGARDVPGTSIKRWNGSVWAIDDSGNSDLVYKAERFAVVPPPPGEEPPEEDPIIIDPGTKRKPTSYDQGIVFPPLGPGDYKALILERLVPPDPDEIGQEDVEQQIVVEIDATIEQEQPRDPGVPLPPPPPPPGPTPPPPGPPPPTPPPLGQLGPYASTGRQLGATTRRATRHYASGKPDDETVEKNTDNIPYDHYQCIYYVTMHGIEHDDTVSVKYGGTHMGTGWFDHSISFEDGETCLGYEPDHPNTHSCVITGPSYGSILEQRIGICGVYRKQANLCELWVRKPATGTWVKALSSDDIDGFDPGNNGDDEAQLRIDGFEDGDDPTIDTAVVQEIAPA